MELKANFAKIVGTPAVGRDSWVYVEDDFFLIIALSGPLPIPIARLGKEIISCLTSDYNNLTKKSLVNLAGLIERVKIEEEISVSILLGVKLGRVFYLVCRGGGQVILKRRGKFGIILDREGSASGILEDKDIILLLSPRFSEIVSLEEIRQLADDFSPDELAEGLTPLVHRVEDTSGVAALILQFKIMDDGEWMMDNGDEETKEAGKVEKTAIGKIRQNLLSSIYHLRSTFQFRRNAPLRAFPLSILQNSLRQPTSPEERKKRLVFWVAIILVILLGASIIFGLGKKGKEKKESRFEKTYELALHQYGEGKALLGLNNLRATTLLSEAKSSLNEIKKDFKKGSSEAKKLEELLKEIEKSLAESSQVYKLNPEVFLDLGIIKEGAEGQKLGLYKDKIIVLDNKNSSVYQIAVKQKSSQILAGGEDFHGSSQIAVSDGDVYVLSEKGILKIGNRDMEIKKDPDWGEIVDLVSFGGNLYLLDKTKNKIWKYVGGEAGFSEKKNYLADEYNLSSSSSMAIDGSVWLTTENRILKFTQGKQDSFEIQGLVQSFGTNLLVFTSDETKNLYILDKSNNRVVVVEKTGTYKSQYVWPASPAGGEGVGEISNFVVSEEEKKIFLLLGSKIYQVEFKI